MAKADFFETFKARVKLATEAEQDQREHEVADLKFEAGEHWTDAELKARNMTSKPSVTIDLLSGLIKQVTNQQRTARPGIKISPVGNGADVEMAERWQGVLRRIERLSNAQRAYTWAGQHQVKMGRGFWVIRNVEVGEDGEQDIRIEAVENQHSILIDPTSKELDGSDKRWAVRYEDLTHDDYIERFGDSRLSSLLGEAFAVPANAVPDWIGSKHARIAEYYYLEEKERTRLILDVVDPGTGATRRERMWEDELDTAPGRDKGKFAKLPQLPAGAIERKRFKKKHKTVHWCLLNGIGEKLDSATIPGEFIPVVMVYGERRFIDGKRDFRGMVRMNKEPSRMLDWAESSILEAISHAKTAPWLLAVGQAEGLEAIWGKANTNPPQALYYHPVDVSGKLVEKPGRIPAGVDVSALTIAAQRHQNHVRNATGMADAFQEETGSLQSKMSGRAIAFRRQNQELGTSDYMEGLGDGIVLTAKVCISMGRQVYDTPRLMLINDEEGKESAIATHAGADQAAQAQQMAEQEKIAGMLDVKVGEYDIALSPGRSHPTARQEAVEAIQGLPPEVIATGADIYVGLLDFPGSQEWAERLKKANPLAQDDAQGDIPPKVQQRLVQLDQFAQQATETINELQKMIDTKAVESQSKEKIEADKLQLEREIEAAKLDLEQMKLNLERDKLALEREKMEAELHKVEMQLETARHQQEAGFAHEIGKAGADTAVASEEGEKSHQRALETSDKGHEQAKELAAMKPKPSGKAS